MREAMLIERYKEADKEGILLWNMDQATLAGRYLSVSRRDPIGALSQDISELKVPSTIGQAAKVIILAARAREQRQHIRM